MNFKLLTAVGLAAGSLLGVTAASAATTVEIGMGASPTALASENTGVTLNYSTTTAGYNSISVSGTGNPPLSLPNILDTTNIDAVGSGLGGTLQIWITEIGLTSPTGTVTFVSGFNLNSDSSAGISVTEQTFYSAANMAFGTTTPLGSAVLGPNGTTSVGDTVTGVTGPYSVTAEYTLNLTAGQSADGTIDISTTPIPGTLPLFASGMVGLWAWSRKRKSQAKLPMAAA
jgi:hypothetical protein